MIIVAILFGSACRRCRPLSPNHNLHRNEKWRSFLWSLEEIWSALVLGLLISTANTSFIATAKQVTQISTDVISLDRLLRRYGPQAQDIRVLLRRYAAAKLQDLFPESSNQAPDLENNATISMLEELQNKVLALLPTNDTQRWL